MALLSLMSASDRQFIALVRQFYRKDLVVLPISGYKFSHIEIFEV